ncbi:MAG: helix-hairpin-helix domain-containing protein [candidate division WOR-3 bacterium]
MTLVILLFTTLSQDLFETEQEKDFETILFLLEDLKNNPVDLNTADLKELSRIPFLKISDCLRIISYRGKVGMYESVDELYMIKGIDKGLVDLIRPYLYVKTKPLKWKGLQSRLRLRKDLDKNGSQEYYTRTTFEVNDYRVFLVTEKDPYESSVIDYYSGGILITEGKRKFALGNYNLDFGSGVMLSSTGSFFQSNEFRLLTREQGVIPYTSTAENGGFFGSALIDSLLLNYCLFYSNQKLDGRIDTSGYARSLDPSGNHIDSASIACKDCIREEIFGYNLSYTKNNLQVSQSSYWSTYEPGFICSDSTIGFYGKNYSSSSLGLKYYADQFVTFAEFVRSFQNRFGGVFGWTGLLPYNFEFNLAGKYFNPGFYAPKGAEAEDDYIGCFIDLGNHSRLFYAGTTINIYSNNQADTNNYDLRLNLGKAFGITEAKITFRWLYRDEFKELSGSRVFLRIKPKKFIYLDLRLEEKYVYGDSLRKGIFGSIECGFERGFAIIKTRLGIFNTDSYSARIYVYEPDLPGIISNRMLYGDGKYGFAYLTLKFLRNISISFKYSIIDKDIITQHIGSQVDIKL